MEDVHVFANVPGALPLVDFQSRRGRQQHSRIQHIQPRKRLVAVADEGAVYMFVSLLQRRILFIRRIVLAVDPALFKLLAHGLKYIPVALALAEDHVGQFLIGGLVLDASSAQYKFKLDPQFLKEKQQRGKNTDQRREQHTSGSGIDIQQIHYRIRLQNTYSYS